MFPAHVYLTSLQSFYSKRQISSSLSYLIHLFICQTTEISCDCLQVGIIIFLNGPNPSNVVPCPYNILAGEVFYRLNGRLISAQQDKRKSHAGILELLLCAFRFIQFEILTDLIMKSMIYCWTELTAGFCRFHAWLTFSPEDEADMFFQNIGLSPNNRSLKPRRLYSVVSCDVMPCSLL